MPIITITSDIGAQDYLVGAIKGKLLQIDNAFQLIDISHHLPPFNYPQAAYVCRNTIKHFPTHSFHIILNSLFDTKAEQLLLAYHKGQYIACADNGLITMILEGKPEQIIGLPISTKQKKDALHYITLIGKAIQKICNGIALDKIGTVDIVYVEKNPLKPLLNKEWIEGQIIFIDHFENVIVNITQEVFEKQRKGRPFAIVFKRNEVIDTLSETYATVEEGEKLALFNAAGYLEIAINKGNAAGLFGLKGYSEIQAQNQYLQNQLFYQTVKIYFE